MSGLLWTDWVMNVCRRPTPLARSKRSITGILILVLPAALWRVRFSIAADYVCGALPNYLNLQGIRYISQCTDFLDQDSGSDCIFHSSDPLDTVMYAMNIATCGNNTCSRSVNLYTMFELPSFVHPVYARILTGDIAAPYLKDTRSTVTCVNLSLQWRNSLQWPRT